MFQCSCNKAVVKLDLSGDCDSTYVIFSLLQITHTRHYSSNNNEIKITHESDGHIKKTNYMSQHGQMGIQTNYYKKYFLPYDPKTNIF